MVPSRIRWAGARKVRSESRGLGPASGWRHRRRVGVAGALFLAGVVLAGCSGSSQGGLPGTDASAEDASGDDDAEMVLDLETGRAETQAGVVQAQRADHSYVAAIGEGKAIGIAPAAEIGVEQQTDGQGRELIVVYVYDRDELAVMVGPLDDDGTATLASKDRDDFDATVELTVTERAASGTVTLPDAQSVEFTADGATGDAGVYWAHGAAQEPDAACDWVVLPDGSQWGCACVPPFTSPCCHLHRL